jgi:hypothetical protein
LHSQLKPGDTIRKIVVYFQTSNDILSGTTNDVWFDIGPKAGRISDGFKKGSVKEFSIDNPSKSTTGASASIEEEVPLLVRDIKMIRIEKKEIRLCDIILGFDLNLCNEMGGLSNAPDHPLELTTPDVITPAGQVAQLKKDIGTANALVYEQQTLLDKGTKELTDLDRKISAIKNKITGLAAKVSTIPQKAADIHKQVLDLKLQLTGIPAKVLTKVCHTVEKKEFPA